MISVGWYFFVNLPDQSTTKISPHKMESWLRKYEKETDAVYLQSAVASLRSDAEFFRSPANLKAVMSMLDLTTLNTTDGDSNIISLCTKVNRFHDHFPEIPNVAAICVYPALVKTVKANLKVPGVKIAAAAGGFPSSQTFLQVKLQECEMALSAGADEIDVVFSVGRFLQGDFKTTLHEIRQIKKVVGEKPLKVILETGAIPTFGETRRASLLAMEGGADFIKTSTGKIQPAASPESVFIMCDAIRDYYTATGKMTGIKPAGGISTGQDALIYFSIVSARLGKKWLVPSLFRIGASRLANNLISEIEFLRTGRKKEIVYF